MFISSQDVPADALFSIPYLNSQRKKDYPISQMKKLELREGNRATQNHTARNRGTEMRVSGMLLTIQIEAFTKLERMCVTVTYFPAGRRPHPGFGAAAHEFPSGMCQVRDRGDSAAGSA